MKWLHTDQLYQRMIAAPDDATREHLYRTELLAPMAAAFAAFKGRMPMGGPASDDLMDQAGAWFWRLPQDFRTSPPDLAHLLAADAWRKSEDALHMAIARFLPYQARVKVETEVTGALVLSNPAPFMPLDGGYAGLQMEGYCIVTYHAPDANNVACAHGAMAHEFNHRIRAHAFPWQMGVTTVAEYVVMEGLAESFAVALFGPEVLGYYVTQITADDLQVARGLISERLHDSDFTTMRTVVFGDTVMRVQGAVGIGMPDFGGYAVGYHLVQAYLQATGAIIEEATLTSAAEIVARSGYFA
jgi:uncharacterized protein YjaZ